MIGYSTQVKVDLLMKEVDWELLRKLVKPVSDFKLSSRAHTGLRNGGELAGDYVKDAPYTCVGDIATQPDATFLSPGLTRNFGRKCLNEVKEVILSPLKLNTGMNIPGWPKRYASSHDEIIALLRDKLDEAQARTLPQIAQTSVEVLKPAPKGTTALQRRLQRRMFNHRISGRHHIPL